MGGKNKSEIKTQITNELSVEINNKTTNMDHHVKYLRDGGFPHYEIKNDDLDYVFKKYTSSYFDETLYKQIIEKSPPVLIIRSALRSHVTCAFYQASSNSSRLNLSM